MAVADPTLVFLETYLANIILPLFSRTAGLRSFRFVQ